MLVSKHATREMCPSLYVFHHFHVLFEDEKTLKDKSQREKYAPQFLDVRVVFFVRFKVCRPFEARECGRERERVREQQQDFSTSHGEKRAQDLAIHIIFVFSNRSVHPSAEVPIKIRLKQTPTPSSSRTPTTSSSWTSFNLFPQLSSPVKEAKVLPLDDTKERFSGIGQFARSQKFIHHQNPVQKVHSYVTSLALRVRLLPIRSCLRSAGLDK